MNVLDELFPPGSRHRKAAIVAASLVAIPLIYAGLAWSVFQWRNPKANQMTFCREFPAVMTWQRLETYQ